MNLPRHSAVTPKAAAHVLWHHGHDSGLRPGSFVRNLLGAIATADSVNAGLLARVYPGYVAAMELAARHAHGIRALEQIAGAEEAATRLGSLQRHVRVVGGSRTGGGR